jgi:hypothetical protein
VVVYEEYHPTSSEITRALHVAKGRFNKMARGLYGVALPQLDFQRGRRNSPVSCTQSRVTVARRTTGARRHASQEPWIILEATSMTDANDHVRTPVAYERARTVRGRPSFSKNGSDPTPSFVGPTACAMSSYGSPRAWTSAAKTDRSTDASSCQTPLTHHAHADFYRAFGTDPPL